jgi:SAM-dependent methyltransferase
MKQQLFICPRCRTSLDRVAADRLVCPRDGLEYWNVDGIWRFLLPESQAHYTRFIAEYEKIRRSEGRGSSDADYYRALPFKDLSGTFSTDWAIRARSFDVLVKQVLTPLQDLLQRPLKVIDLGAGNGWLSNHLAAQGDRVFAVDLLVNEQDGLGAWKYYEHPFTPMQAEFNHLPIMDRFADVVIFNASFHYSEDYIETLKEALRVLNVEGMLVIMDSPIYRRRSSGEKMVEERKAAFLAQYGLASDSLESENFLTYQQIGELGDSLGIRWMYFRPFYGLRWFLRPLKAWLTRKREPARFHLIAAFKEADQETT